MNVGLVSRPAPFAGLFSGTSYVNPSVVSKRKECPDFLAENVASEYCPSVRQQGEGKRLVNPRWRLVKSSFPVKGMIVCAVRHLKQIKARKSTCRC